MRKSLGQSYDTPLRCALALSGEYNRPQVSETDTEWESAEVAKVANWVNELTLIKETEGESRVNKKRFCREQPEESRRTVLLIRKSVGYSEYFKSQQTGKVVEAKYDVHKVGL